MDRNLPVFTAVAYLLEHGGALVSSGACSALEIACARAEGRMWVTPDGLGLICRPTAWLQRVEALSAADVATAGPRFITLSHHSGTLAGGTNGDGPFGDWLQRNAPSGYRLVHITDRAPWAGRPEMPHVRECLFEKDGERQTATVATEG